MTERNEKSERPPESNEIIGQVPPLPETDPDALNYELCYIVVKQEEHLLGSTMSMDAMVVYPGEPHSIYKKTCIGREVSWDVANASIVSWLLGAGWEPVPGGYFRRKLRPQPRPAPAKGAVS